MAKRQRKVAAGKSEVEQQIPVACADESAAVDFMERQRGWVTEVDAVCPKCGVVGDSYKMRDKATGERNKRFLWRCRACGSQYTVKVGTVMEDSPIPVRFWCLAFFRAASSKKGVSALQIQRETGLTYKSALFLMHRIRWAMRPANEQESKLGGNGGIVEFDETYIGGKPRGHVRYSQEIKADGSRKGGPAVDFGDRKTPVVGGVERDGRVKARVAMNLTKETLGQHVTEMVDPKAHLQTDQLPTYKGIAPEFERHERVRHNAGQYVRYTTDDIQVTTNRIEGFWAGLKRRINGTHHSVTRKHLHRYLSEAEYLYNTRHMDDGERTVNLIRATVNRRLTYRQQIARPRDAKGRYTWRGQ
jgi:transposase-like protein